MQENKKCNSLCTVITICQDFYALVLDIAVLNVPSPRGDNKQLGQLESEGHLEVNPT